MDYNHITFLKNYHCVQDLPCYYPITKYFFMKTKNDNLILEEIIRIEDSEVSNNKYISYLDHNGKLEYKLPSELEKEEIEELTKKYLPNNNGELTTIEEHTEKILWGIEETTQKTVEKNDKFKDIKIYSYKFRLSDPFKDSNTEGKLIKISEYLIKNKDRFESCLFTKIIKDSKKFDNYNDIANSQFKNNSCEIFSEIFPS